MKRSTILSILLLAIAALSGCGGQGRHAASAPARFATAGSYPSGDASTSSAASPASTSSAIPHYPGAPWSPVDSDGDGDSNSDEHIRMPGREGSPSQWRAISAMIKRYYSAALGDDGGLACRMLSASLARSMVIEQGRFGARYLRGGKTCAGIASKLFKHEHRLVDELASTEKLIDVRLEGDHGYAAMNVDLPCVRGHCMLNVRTVHVAEVYIKHEGDSWKMDSILKTG